MAEQFCTFFLEDLSFGIAVTQVQEVIRLEEMTPVPLVSSHVRGLLNLRGQIVTAIDLRSCLELAERSGGETPMNVVIRTDEGLVSLLVDRIGDVLEVDDRQFEAAPERLSGRARELIKGTYKLEERLLHVLDVDRTIVIAGEANN